MGRRVVVTGGAGFIGSHLVRALAARGDEVRVFDDLSSGRRENLAGVEAELIVGDLRDAEAVNAALRGCEQVYHLGARPSVPRSVAEPRVSHEVNIDGSLNLLLAARDAEVQAVVMASSSSVYGETPTLPKSEDMSPAPLSPYAQQKLAMEHMGQVYARCYGLRVIALRYFNVFGPRQDPNSAYAAVVPHFTTRLLAGAPPIIYGSGAQTRDFTFVDNVVQANLLAAERGAGGLVCNIACGAATSVSELAEALGRLVGQPIAPRHEDPRPGDVLHSHAAIDKAREALGFEPEVSLEDGLARTVAWYREQAAEAQA